MPIKPSSVTERSQDETAETASVPDSFHGLLGNYNKNSHGSGSSESSGAGPHYQLKTSKDSGEFQKIAKVRLEMIGSRPLFAKYSPYIFSDNGPSNPIICNLSNFFLYKTQLQPIPSCFNPILMRFIFFPKRDV